MRGFMNELKVGLVLSAGGAKGLAHIGVIKVLEKNKIPIHCISGTSAGALIGGVYASGVSIDKIEEIVLSMNYKELAKLIDLTKPTTALIKGDKINQFILKKLHKQRIEDFKIPFAAVAADLLTSRKVILDKGDAVTAIRASGSLPGIFKPVRYKGMFLIDGGVVDPLPVDVAKDMGADVIIAVNLTGSSKINSKYFNKSKEPNIVDTLLASIGIFERQIINLTLEKVKDKNMILIRPDVSKIGIRDFVKAKKAIKQGEIATEEKIDEILKVIKER